MDSIANDISFYAVAKTGRTAKYNARKSRGTHQGQRKLNVMEIFFIKRYGRPGDNILYVGAAPGTHIVDLSKMFPQMTFVLYDPLSFDKRLYSLPNVKVNQCFFTHETASEYKANPETCLFICDIRSSGYATGFASEENDDIITRDMTMQLEWTVMLNARFSMLKFKPLYPGSQGGKETFDYLDGELFMQPFAKLGSTEMRLVVHETTKLITFNKAFISNTCAYFNQRIRTTLRDTLIERAIIDAPCME